jgi:salicylate hydroxylase
MTAATIIVVGGGIGGLAAAVALQQRGFAVRVYERATELREIGAGVIIQPNGRQVLADLGLDDRLAERSSCMTAMYTCDYATGAVLQRTANADVARAYGRPLLAVHRADLHDVLLHGALELDPNTVRAGHGFVGLEQDADGVTVRFDNGVTDRADVVIGADGISSSVRSLLFPGEFSEFNGQVAFRALVPEALVPASIRERELAMHRAPGRYLLHYPLRGGTIMNLIGCGQTDTWEAEGWSIPATNDEFLAAYDDFAPDLLQLIRNIPDGELFKWGLRDRAPLGTWTVGRVAMLGDAAHPMTPFLGQGACMAMEDGLVLGRAFAASTSVADALSRYERVRKPRGNGVQLMSLEEGRALQDPTLERKGAAGFGLLDYDAATVPV